MAYEDYYDDPMANFSDDVSYYDEELGFYDDFNERLDKNTTDQADDAAEDDSPITTNEAGNLSQDTASP